MDLNEFGVSGLVFWVSGILLWVSGLDFWVSGLDFGCLDMYFGLDLTFDVWTCILDASSKPMAT